MGYVNGFRYEFKEQKVSSNERVILLGQQLKYFRENLGMSQKFVCNRLGLSPQTYSGYECGRHEPPLEMLVRLSYLFDVSLDALCVRMPYIDPVSFVIEP